MAKILISSLGTGRNIKDSDSEYESTTYLIDDKKYPKETFISKSLIKHYDIDKVILLGTNKSMWDGAYFGFSEELDSNWERLNNQKTGEGICKEDLAVIEKVLNDYIGKDGSKALLVKYGQNEDEMWENFEIMYNINQYINEGDEVYLDITHAFRSLPVMMFIVMEFMHIKRNDFKLSGLLYGMLSDDKSPVIDLKIFFELLDWAKAISAMKYYGNLDPLVLLLERDNNEEKGVEKIFAQLNNNIKIANLASIKQFVTNASKKINVLQKSENKIVKLLSGDIIAFIERLNKDKMSDFQFELAKWFYDNKQYALSYMALAEAIITKTCELDEVSIYDKECRNNAKAHIMHPFDDMYLERPNTKKENKNSISTIRNNIAHQLNDRKDLAKQDIDRLQIFLEKFDEYFMKERVTSKD